jgi:hypothetical protein
MKVALGPDVMPSALIVMPEHWTAALLKAELLERGWDAACAPSMAEGLVLAAGRKISVALVDQAALSSRDPRLLAWAVAHEGMRLVLLTGAMTEQARGPWQRVLRRPLSLGAIADALASSASAPSPRVETGFSVRLDKPWPAIACAHCGRSRHYEMPRGEGEMRAVEADLPAFVVEHARCKG